MRPQTMRRLAADISALHNQQLPPNYLFPLESDDNDDLTQLDILLTGPAHTPFSEGVWRLHLNIPVDYPSQPPTATFRTAIFHPNVHPDTGGVCVETLKRDWDSKLTLRDVLITISCLLIQPNPDSALNAEAGSLIQEDFEMFARRARLMTSIHASVPASMSAAVREARMRGQEADPSGGATQAEASASRAPIRQRRQMTRARQRDRPRRSEGSPVNSLLGRRHAQGRVQQQDLEDVFQTPVKLSSDDIMDDANQENFATLAMPAVSRISTPRRPAGPSVPLGELSMSSDEDDIEREYPPSPKKSHTKSPVKRLFQADRPESSRQAAQRAEAGSPVQKTHSDTSYHLSSMLVKRSTPDYEPVKPTKSANGNYEVNADELWMLCGQDISRWNRGDFDRQPFPMVAARW